MIKATSDDLRHAYRLLLGREPDTEGFASLRKHIETSKPKATDLAAMFFASAQFKKRHADTPQLDEITFDGLKLYPWRGDSLIGDLNQGDRPI